MPNPLITYPADLPVSAQRQKIASAIRENQVVIVAGATGSGKTTQLPKICLDLGRNSIAHTQPRRIAARTIAERIAEETNTALGGLVGYQIRFTDKASDSTKIKVMTDGILLNEIHRDRLLKRYDTIIIDEAHERSLNIDFLLGYLKQLLPKRPELRVVVTSATIDPDSFANHFADAAGNAAPIIEVSGRTYPVEIRYRPLVTTDSILESDAPDGTSGATRTAKRPKPNVDDSKEHDLQQAIIAALDELESETPGDVLVFLSGESEIRDTEKLLRAHLQNTAHGLARVTEVLPLYGRLSVADQHRVFAPTISGVHRRIILATNVAETSLTVPGIRYVVDAGHARISRYSARSKIQRLPIEAVSQASANQRSGRSGRTSPGIAIRLYSLEDFERRPEYTEPEILRTNLAAVILQMTALGIGTIENFPFLTPPDSRGIRDGIELLRELGAMDDTAASLTRIGRQLARLPIEPRFGRMVIEAKAENVVREVLAIVTGLTIQDPRERPLDKREQADVQHRRFTDPSSDFLTMLNLWNHIELQQQELSGNAFRKMCRAEYLSYSRVREWQDLYRQLIRLCKPLGISVNKSPSEPNPDGIHRALLAGLLSHIGLLDERNKTNPVGDHIGKARSPRRSSKAYERATFLGARGTKFTIFPGSALAKKPPLAVMAAELVETSELFARTVAAIDPAWAEPLASGLVKRSLSEPRWERRTGSAVADEKVFLYGVPIIAKRRMRFARADPEQAREIFIRNALTQEDWDWQKLDQRIFRFIRDNRRMRHEIAELEARQRRPGLLIIEENIDEFYFSRVPQQVVDSASFERWWRQEHLVNPQLLTMSHNSLLIDNNHDADTTAFPSEWVTANQKLKLKYQFDPGADSDGVSVMVPLVLLPRIKSKGFDWQIPGMRTELVTAMLRTLPKVLRRQVVPAAEWATKLSSELTTGAELGNDLPPLTDALAQAIRKLTFAPVDPSDFDLSLIPPHLTVRFCAVDERGKPIDADRNLAALQTRLSDQAASAIAQTVTVGAQISDTVSAEAQESVSGRAEIIPAQTGITTWLWERLPNHVETDHGGHKVRAYPAIVDEITTVSLRYLPTPEERDLASKRGIRRLVLLAIPTPVSYVQDHLTSDEKLLLGRTGSPRAILNDCLVAIVDDTISSRDIAGLIKTRTEFTEIINALSANVLDRMFAMARLVANIFRNARNADQAISQAVEASGLSLMQPLSDARNQLGGLVTAGFIATTGMARLQHLPRYLVGISVRVRRLLENPGRDRQIMNEFEGALTAFHKAGGRIPILENSKPELIRVRWLLEELRISLFAQELRAAEPVSVKRILKALTSPAESRPSSAALSF